ncbi:hypothetical protein [Streptomyces sp. NPDC048710]|uniref:hypothetical protein n=1 Tax=Streptomyces sp. NPDC048710 TaxID=3365586 RepID=UPI0037169F9F
MTPFVLPHEVHGDGTHEVFAVHGSFADRSAYEAVLPDLDRTAFTYTSVEQGVLFADAAHRPENRRTIIDFTIGSRRPAAWYPRTEPVGLPGAGHCAVDETPLELIRAVEDFLRADEGEPA